MTMFTVFVAWLFFSHFFNWFEVTNEYIIIHRVLRPSKKYKRSELDLSYYNFGLWIIKKREPNNKTISYISLALWDDNQGLFNAIKGITLISYDELADLFRNRKNFSLADINDNIYDIQFYEIGFRVDKTDSYERKSFFGNYRYGKDFLDDIRINKYSYIGIKK